jgi:hypothetical protein
MSIPLLPDEAMKLKTIDVDLFLTLIEARKHNANQLNPCNQLWINP